MRILIITPWLPHPRIAHAGGQHLYHTVLSLVERGHEIHLLGYRRDESPEEIEALSALCSSLTMLTPAYTVRQKLSSLRHPQHLGRRTHAEARLAIPRICEEQQIEVVHLAWTEMGRYLDAVPLGMQIRTVLGTLDVEYLVRLREVALFPPGWAKIRAAWRAWQLIRIERSAVSQADITVACSEADRGHLARFVSPDRIHVVPPWIDAETMRDIMPDSVVPGRLVMVGALDRIANQAAARFLVDKVWKIVREANASATLRIVGAHPPQWLIRRAQSDSRLTVTGYVADLVSEWAAADIALSPSLIGGGLLVKVAQPMAAGRPVITTTRGVEGVGAPKGAVVIANAPADFASATLRLLDDRDEWARIAAAGRGHIVDHFDWQASINCLESAYVQW